MLGICFGVQSLNVWRGGSLVQDLTPLPVNHSAGSKVAIAHTALVAKNSLLASLLTEEEAPEVDGFFEAANQYESSSGGGGPGNRPANCGAVP